MIETNRILASSCLVRRRDARGTFYITGNGGLPQRPGDPATPWFPTGEVQAIPGAGATANGEDAAPIVEIDGIYPLPTGQIVLGRRCAGD